MAELNRSLLEDYNSLSDKHLANYFNNPRIRRHLVQAGLVRQNGEIVSSKDYKARLMEEQRWLASQAFLAQAIVQRALDLEFTRRAQLQRQLEEVIRIELVERVRSARRKSGSASNPSSSANRAKKCSRALVQSPDQCNEEPENSASPHNQTDASLTNEGEYYNANSFNSSQSDSGSVDIEDQEDDQDFSYHHRKVQNRPYSTMPRLRIVDTEEMSPYSLPTVHRHLRKGNRSQSAPYRLSRTTSLNKKRGMLLYQMQRELSPGPKNVQYSCCDMTLRFLGTRMFISKNVNGGRQEVLVKQQMSGGNPVIVFFQPILPGSTFTFTSRRYYDFPLSITIHVDGLVALRLSACCEYKYQIGRRLGGYRGYFLLENVTGQSLCLKCNKEKTNSSFLPPVLKQTASNNIPKPFIRIKPTWSQSEGNRKISFIAPLQRQSVEQNPRPKTPDSLDGSEDDSYHKHLNSNLASPVQDHETKIGSRDNEYDKCEEIEEEIQPLQTDTLVQDEKTEEIEECIGSQPSCDEESYSEDSENSNEDSDGSYSEKTEGNSVSDSNRSNESHDHEAEGPEITVTRPDTDESLVSTSQHGSETESGSGSDTQESAEEDCKICHQYLTPEDARKIPIHHKKTVESTSSATEPAMKEENERILEKNDLHSSKLSVIGEEPELDQPLNDRFDSSDEEEPKTLVQTTVVTADVHVAPVSSGEISKASSECEISDSNALVDGNENHDEKEEVKNEDPEQASNEISANETVADAHDQKPSDSGAKQRPSRSYSLEGIEGTTELELDGEILTDFQIEELCDVIAKSHHLEVLGLRKCGIHDAHLIPIADALIESQCPLKTLNFNLNHLGPQAGQEIVRIIQAKHTLQALFLHGNPIHDSGLCPIAEALLQLNLSQKNPEEGGLQRLDVGDCNFRNDGANSLASLIEQSPALTTLILTGNSQLKHEEWSSVFWAIGQNYTMSVLLLDYCGLGDKGVDVFVKELPYHPTLHELDLEGNEISDEGGLQLLNWLRQNMTVHELRMENGNNMKEGIMVDMIRLLDNRRV